MIRLESVFQILIPIFLLYGCVQNQKQSDEISDTSIPLKYAKAFNIFKNIDGYTINVLHPGTSEILQTIHLSRNAENDNFKLNPSSIVCISTTYLAFIKELNKLVSIKGISNTGLVYDNEIRNLIKQGLIVEVGNDQAINNEKLIDLKSDMVFFYDFGPSTTAVVKRLEEFGLKVVRVAEFMEESPLGKAEWIKFFGVIYDELDVADSIFNSIEKNYLNLQGQYGEFESSPKVFTGLPWKGEWYQPGGASFQAEYFTDAGADYIWREDTNVSGITIDREIVFDKAIDADIWLHPSNALNLDDITGEDERFKVFKSFKTGQVFNNNNRLNESMGNDYWESGLLHPDVVLNDLLAIMHPELFPDYQLYYYRKLE